jgi:hypothetical protein
LIGVFKYLMSVVEIMTGARMPGFTAEASLGNFIQGYNLTRSGSDSIRIVPTLDFGPRMKAGCCGGWCDPPCEAHHCHVDPTTCCCGTIPP